MTTYNDYREARKSLMQSLGQESKQKLEFLKEQMEQRKRISEIKKTKFDRAAYDDKYDELCALEQHLGLTDLAKAFCKSQAIKYKIKSMLDS